LGAEKKKARGQKIHGKGGGSGWGGGKTKVEHKGGRNQGKIFWFKLRKKKDMPAKANVFWGWGRQRNDIKIQKSRKTT